MLITGGGALTGTARTYTMRELSQRTAQVIDEINDHGEQALVTKHGRIIALITPMREAAVESIVLSRGPVSDALQDRINDDSQESYSSDEVAEKIRRHHVGDDDPTHQVHSSAEVPEKRRRR
ncbi:MAG: hypothetical protein JWO67_1319 [Streptosporangiaceae bacterium]|nr:hypothetical protein [Streptosporangiaceae bacterium]